MALGIPPSLLGLHVSGDVDGLTIYTDRNFRKIAFPQAPPKKPPSALQLFQRERWRLAIAEYMSLQQAERDALDTCTRRLALGITGLNLWLYLYHKGDLHDIATFERHGHVTLPIPSTLTDV